jgi:hypothetical protein
MHARQQYEGGQLLQEFQRREPNARGAVRPRVCDGVDRVAVGVLRQTLQGYGPTGRITDEPLQLVASMGWDVGVGVHGKALHAGTAGTRQRGRLAVHAKAGAHAPHLLPGPLAKGQALLHRGG